MKKLVPFIYAILFCTALQAQGSFNPFGPAAEKKSPVRLEYDTFFEYYFENREFTNDGNPAICEKYMRSGTINAMALTPSIGFSFCQGESANHRISLGIDFRQDMGSAHIDRQTVGDALFHYDGHVRLDNGAMFEGIIGVFPRRFSEGEYGEIFFSDSTLFTDRNLDGALLKYRARRFYAELASDWMGKADVETKERFMLMSSGLWTPKDWLQTGWAFTFYHYAGSVISPGVVDNHLFEPFVRLNLARAAGLQELSLKLGAPLSYQWDRIRENSASLHLGMDAVVTAKYRSLGLRNAFFYGSNFQHLYNDKDTGGNKYGNMLYLGSPFYAAKIYDKLEFFWAPKISDFISLDITVRFGFCPDGFLGWQQFLRFSFNLDRLRHSDQGSGRTGKAV